MEEPKRRGRPPKVKVEGTQDEIGKVVNAPPDPVPAVIPQAPQAEVITESKLQEYMKSFGLTTKLRPDEAQQFIAIAREFNLNPFKREIHCAAYGEGEYRTLSIVVGYEVYLKRAERLHRLNGWSVKTEGEGNDMKAVVTIYRKDWAQPFVHEAWLKEVAQYKKNGEITKFWSKMPKFMCKKVAIAQAFRLCFPDEMGGLPYVADEMPGEEITAATPAPVMAMPEPIDTKKLEALTAELDAELTPIAKMENPEPPKPTNSPAQALNYFSQIMQKLNNSTIAPEQKVKIVKEARDARGDNEKLKAIYATL